MTPIALGDLVVHAEHGVGLCEGLEAVDAGGAPHDCVRLIYQQGDKLFVPVENMDLLWRFGAPGETIQLDKLGGNAWPNRLERVREAMREAAHELVTTAAKREIAEVEPIVPPPAAYRRFSTRFPYTETDDQQSAIDDVLADLASGKVMDRLVVGDVGFGKTEVALRAAFAAASCGRQVAVVAPTTPLARQHADEFRERFSGFGYEVAELSRTANPAEAKEARKRIASSEARIVIGNSGAAQRSRLLQGSWPAGAGRGTAPGREAEGAAEGDRRWRPCADYDGDADPPHPSTGIGGPARSQPDRHPAGRAPAGPDPRPDL